MKDLFVILIAVSSGIYRVSDEGKCHRDTTCHSVFTRREYYSTSCGWWSRCTKSRIVYIHSSYSCQEEICCEGYTGSDCRTPTCNAPCKNGGECVAGNVCSCPTGFTPPYCDPICTTPCKNGGACTAPDVCNCLAGYSAPYCDAMFDCGTPTPILCGSISYTTTTSGSTASYICEANYNLTGGNTIRTCQSDHGWSGQRPRCAYTNYCATSKPCQNGAVCTDMLDDYLCTCLAGWSGKNCDADIQPPVMFGCPPDISLNATQTTKYAEWQEPTFKDPFGNYMTITRNYKSQHYEFPWGDFKVKYTATKPSNGLSAECVFTVKVRPTPCNELNIPDHGSRICNGWKTDFGKFCLVACNRDYMIDPAHQFGMLSVCGASGNWIAPAPDCNIPVDDEVEVLLLHPEFFQYSYDNNCTDTVTTKYLQEVYLDRLCGDSGEFKDFCQTYPEESILENVEVVCQ